MGIARALRRVKRQAKQGGLSSMRSEIGEGLRSRAVPAPLRGAARKLASLIDPTRPAKKAHHAPSHAAPRTHAHADAPEIDPGIARPPAEVTATGVDSGAEPAEPLDGTPVDATTVGATPTYNATPIEVEPVDATPVAVSPAEVTALEITALEIEPLEAEPPEAEPAEAKPTAAKLDKPKPASTSSQAASKSKPQPRKSLAKKPPTSVSAPSAPEATKEKLAADHGAAKHLARSGSRTAKKHGSPSADTTSKKK
jgi:hypothetical protein